MEINESCETNKQKNIHKNYVVKTLMRKSMNNLVGKSGNKLIILKKSHVKIINESYVGKNVLSCVFSSRLISDPLSMKSNSKA